MTERVVKDYSKKIMTVPNILSFIRLGAVPVFIYIFYAFYYSIPYLAGVVFALITITDFVDGIIARSFGMVSDAGKVLDPLADKVAQLAGLICLVSMRNVHWIFAVILLAKEVYLVVFGVILYNRQFVLGARMIGKVASVVLNVALFLTFFVNVQGAGDVIQIISTWMFGAGLVLSVAATVYYTILTYRETGGHLPPKKEKI